MLERLILDGGTTLGHDHSCVSGDCGDKAFEGDDAAKNDASQER
jgi:hypothetical protein